MTSILSQSCLALMLAVLLTSNVVAQDVPGPDGDIVFVKVAQNRELSGTPIDLNEFKLTTGFGEVTIPMNKVNGIKLHATEDDSAIIAFKNGDLVTGKIMLETISIKTSWGKAHIKASQINSITNNRAARFLPDNSGGKKGWKFSNGTTG